MAAAEDARTRGVLARSYASAQLVWKLRRYIPTAAATAVTHLTSSTYPDAWPLSTSLFVALARFSSDSARARRHARALGGEVGEVDVVAETQKNRARIERLIVGESGRLPKNGVVVPVSFRVRSRRGLPGILAEPDSIETGERRVGAEWSAHDSLWAMSTTPPAARVVLFFHGGAYCLLSPKTHRPLCLRLSRELGARVFSVDYRLAPETKFPGALHDAVSAYLYLTQELGIAPTEILVAGDSAGGNLATALVLYLRDHSARVVAPVPRGVVLLSPWVDLTASFASWDSNRVTDYLALDDLTDPLVPTKLFARTERDLVDRYASPAIASDVEFAGFPPVVVVAGQGETLRDEIAVLAQRLDRAGVDVTHEEYEGGVHVFVAVTVAGLGECAITRIGEWSRHPTRFARARREQTTTTLNESDDDDDDDGDWARIESELDEAYRRKRDDMTRNDDLDGPGRKQQTDPPRRREEDRDEPRFVFEATSGVERVIELRPRAHPAARAALDELARLDDRGGGGSNTVVVRAKRNPKYQGGWWARLHI
ncbi:hypothetical protein JCM11491_004663 [Sporobolomyces phaffii]